MIERRMIYYPITTRHESENARTEIYLDEAQFVIAVILGFGDAKSFKVIVREDIKNSVDSTVTFSASLRFIFNVPSTCQEFGKYHHIFFFRVIYVIGNEYYY